MAENFLRCMVKKAGHDLWNDVRGFVVMAVLSALLALPIVLLGYLAYCAVNSDHGSKGLVALVVLVVVFTVLCLEAVVIIVFATAKDELLIERYVAKHPDNDSVKLYVRLKSKLDKAYTSMTFRSTDQFSMNTYRHNVLLYAKTPDAGLVGDGFYRVVFVRGARSIIGFIIMAVEVVVISVVVLGGLAVVVLGPSYLVYEHYDQNGWAAFVVFLVVGSVASWLAWRASVAYDYCFYRELTKTRDALNAKSSVSQGESEQLYFLNRWLNAHEHSLKHDYTSDEMTMDSFKPEYEKEWKAPRVLW